MSAVVTIDPPSSRLLRYRVCAQCGKELAEQRTTPRRSAVLAAPTYCSRDCHTKHWSLHKCVVPEQAAMSSSALALSFRLSTWIMNWNVLPQMGDLSDVAINDAAKTSKFRHLVRSRQTRHFTMVTRSRTTNHTMCVLQTRMPPAPFALSSR